MIKHLGVKKNYRAAILLTGMLTAFSGCGKEIQSIDEYGGQSVDSAVVLNDETSEAEKSEAVTSDGSMVSEGSLKDKLGNSEFDFNESVEVNNVLVNFNLHYTVPDVQSVPTYKISPITSATVDEETWVRNMFGDTAVAYGSGDKETLDHKKGDNHFIVEEVQEILYENQIEDNIIRKTPAWYEEDGFFLHTYEGVHNDITYQMIISYSDSERELCIVYYPKNMSDVIDDKSLEYFSYTDIDGLLYTWNDSTMKSHNIAQVMSNRPNECTLTDEELSESIINNFKDNFGITLPEEAVALHSDMTFNYVAQSESKTSDKAGEIIFYNDDVAQSDNLEGAVRHGYTAFVLESLSGIPFAFDYSNMIKAVYVDNDGVFGAQIMISYTFDEQSSEDSTLLTFDNAMECLKKAVQNDLDVEIASHNNGSSILFDDISLRYYPQVSPDDNSEATYIPVWVVNATNKNQGYSDISILINAVDGSLIDILYHD